MVPSFSIVAEPIDSGAGTALADGSGSCRADVAGLTEGCDELVACGAGGDRVQLAMTSHAEVRVRNIGRHYRSQSLTVSGLTPGEIWLGAPGCCGKS